MTATATPVQTDSETLVNRIIAELRADPAAQDMLLKALLTGEFLGIPVRLEGIEDTLRSIQASIGAIETRLDRLEDGQRRLEEGQQRTEGRLDRLEAGQQRTEGRLDRLEAGQQRTEGRLDRLEAGQQRIEDRQQRTEERLDRLETTVDRIDNTVNRLDATVDRIDATVTRLDTTVRRLDNTVGRLDGRDYEARLAKNLATILSQRIGLRRAQTIRSAVDRMPPEISAQLEDAVEENLISDSQGERITETDIIIRAQRKSDRAWIWIAVEASVSIHRDDIDRARQSADALAAVFAEPAIPVAVGQRIAPPETQHAQAAAVHTTIVT